MCVVVNSTDERQKPVYDTAGQLFNGSPARALEVVCPVVGPFDDLSVHPNPNATPGANGSWPRWTLLELKGFNPQPEPPA